MIKEIPLRFHTFVTILIIKAFSVDVSAFLIVPRYQVFFPNERLNYLP